ncbi:MAG: transketolase family protein [Acidimicrobiales bacterium]
MASRLSADTDRMAVAIIRGLAMDAPLAARSGHQGTAMALAPLAHVLYSRLMRFDPDEPTWFDRDRFILSGGHASILQYAMLHLAGFGLTMDDIRNFRQWGSATPGHPEAGHTAGVEVTTGPLGQGFANAVGMAIAEAHLRAVHGDAVSHRTWVIAGDGCLMEGISHEAASLAGHLGLDRLVCVFDDNEITIDGGTDLSCSDDVMMRFRSYGWNVIDGGEPGDDLDAIEQVLIRAATNTGSPTLVRLRTHIGHPSPDLTDSHEAHGNPFTESHVSTTKSVMGIPDTPFWAPDEIVQEYRTHVRARAAEVRAGTRGGDSAGAPRAVPPPGWEDILPRFDSDTSLATRQAFQKALEASKDVLPWVLSGAADLTGNTGAKIDGKNPFTRHNPSGRQVYYGIREHAMGAALVGMALHGGVLPVGGTFFVFADYMRPAIRLAALSRAKCVFVFSHDSVGVGEDGPTHQPVEQLASLRAMPGLRIIRPADPNETVAAWRTAVESEGPTVLVLSRQNVDSVTDGSAVTTGAATIRERTGARAVIVATGSEVGLAVKAAEKLETEGLPVSVVSMPSWDIFAAQPKSLRDEVLPPGLPVVSVEAGTTFGWERWADVSVGIDRFGASAPGGRVLEELGMNVETVSAAVRGVATP